MMLRIAIAMSYTVLVLSTVASPAHADSLSELILQKSNAATTNPPNASYAASSAIDQHLSYYRRNDQGANHQGIHHQGLSNQGLNNHGLSQSRTIAFAPAGYDNVDDAYLPLLSHAETQSSPAAREVIRTARQMALEERAIIKGSCWDYLNAVFNRAGVTRDTIHNGKYRQGPYAQPSHIQAGDWLYYINHGYRGVEHSGLFIGWTDQAANEALILSYAGENRREPARYRVYDLSNVYHIMRPTI